MASITIQKWGNSHGIRIPKSILDDIGLKEGEQCNIEIKNNSIVVSKIEMRKNIIELFENYSGNEKINEIDWGEPVGKEVW